MQRNLIPRKLVSLFFSFICLLPFSTSASSQITECVASQDFFLDQKVSGGEGGYLAGNWFWTEANPRPRQRESKSGQWCELALIGREGGSIAKGTPFEVVEVRMQTGQWGSKFAGVTTIFLKSRNTLNPSELQCFIESDSAGVLPLSLDDVLKISSQIIQCQ